MTSNGSNKRILCWVMAMLHLFLSATFVYGGAVDENTTDKACCSHLSGIADASDMGCEKNCPSTPGCHSSTSCGHCYALINQHLALTPSGQPNSIQPTEHSDNFFPPTELRPPRSLHQHV